MSEVGPCLLRLGLDYENHTSHPSKGEMLLYLGGCETGDAKITKAYNLPCRFVIHTPGPIWNGGNRSEAEKLASSYRRSLEVAEENGVRSIAFPSISTGVYHFPLEQAAEIAVGTARAYAAEHPDAFDRIVWVLFDDKTKAAYDRALSQS